MAMKHRFATGAGENDGFLAKLRPASTTMGYFVDVTQENLTLVAKKNDTLPETLGSESEIRALGVGLHFSGDWKWVGITRLWAWKRNFPPKVFWLGLGKFSSAYGLEDVPPSGLEYRLSH